MATSNLNWMRKLQLTYTASRSFDVGVAAMWLGHPTWMRFSYIGGSSSTNSTSSQELNANGYFAVGIFKPLGQLRKRSWQWDVGLGAGLSHIEGTVTTNSSSWSTIPPYTHTSNNSVSKINTNVLSALAYTEFKLFIADYFTLGVIADYAYIPKDILTTASSDGDEKKIGTSSIGFTIGFHF
jgi:hypothetical protein